MTSAEIRQSYLDFFKSKGHSIVPSSSLLPESPGLLFTNAGMNQFVPIFLNEIPCPYTPARAADTQKCIRAGGKHNDLEDVGLDTYHHTLFEMLGNWSFGDYFKKEAIEWAWELVVETWKFPANRVYATVYHPDKAQGDPADFDQEAYDIWAKLFEKAGLDPQIHIVNGNKKDNFWMMGETGPCGPCSEIHIDLTPEDRTPELEKRGAGMVNSSDARCIEIWNLVFIQFNAGADGSFKPLPAQHVDTGMGFERVCSIIQGTKNFTDFKNAKISNYDTDVFRPIFDKLEELSGLTYASTLPNDQLKTENLKLKTQIATDVAMRVIGDHIRTLSLSIADGILPGNEGRNYVLRRILRRAVRYGRELGFHELFFYKLVDVVAQSLGPIFPELIKNKALVEKVIRAEEESFSRTLDRGIALFNTRTSSSERSAGILPAVVGILPATSSTSGAKFSRRRLPHYEQPYGIYHVTFSTAEKKPLSEPERDIILSASRHFHDQRYQLFAACVMPDHVHLLLQPLPQGRDEKDNLSFHSLSDLMHSIKSFSSKEINKLRNSSGSVWETESFDRLMKSDAELSEVFEYICGNPTKAGLVFRDVSYPWLWTLGEGVRQDAELSRRDACAPPEIPGALAFELYDTYGFPLDLTELMARERGLTVDVDGFNKLMTEQKERSKAAQKKEIIEVTENEADVLPTTFVGFDQKEAEIALASYKIIFGKTEEDTVKARLFFTPSPFYAEMGGQVGDTGWLEFDGKRVEILNTLKAGHGSIAHITEDLELLEELSFPAKAVLNLKRRALIEAHHSATHILHWALREVLGSTVGQKGSYVGPDRLRFDFSHPEAVKPEELQKVEELVNERITQASKVEWTERPYAEVKNDASIIQFFGDKYGEIVRVVNIGGFSKELCGGTHVRNTQDIGVFRLISEGAIAAGVRRIEAVCGPAIHNYLESAFAKQQEELTQLLQKSGRQLSLKTVAADPAISWAHFLSNQSAISNQKSEILQFEKEQAKNKSAEFQKQASALTPDWINKATEVNGTKLILENLGEIDPAFLQLAASELKKSFQGVAVLGGSNADKVFLLALVTEGKANAGHIIKEIAPIVGGKGGGKPDLAQGGGIDPSKIDEALTKAKALI
jgi:alanyl-tRNA synthetase/REP element-mobilizing transposase RayT